MGHDLSHIKYEGNGDHSNAEIAIVVSKWNPEITGALYAAARQTLIEAGVPPENIQRYSVPGTFELTIGAQMVLESDYRDFDAVLCIGCVIQGETRHFEFICQAVSQGITQVGLESSTPVIFGVLTPDTLQQAQDRAGGKYGNKGEEAAVAALEMMDLQNQILNDNEE